MNKRPTALILGISGAYGGAMARALLGAGYTLRALVRDEERGRSAASKLAGPVELVRGDILEQEGLAAAARGAEVIVHGVNAPYHRWDPFVVGAARAVGAVAARAGATVLFPGNVYNFAPGSGIDERAVMAPPSAMGALRVEAEQVLCAAVAQEGRLVVLRGGDFFGAGRGSGWMSEMLAKAVDGGAIMYPGVLHARHQWAYLPDFASAHLALLRRSQERVVVRHFEGHILTGAELVAQVRRVLGDPKRTRRGLPWPLMGALALFSPLVREVRRMRYLWDTEVLMDGGLLREELGDALPRTAFAEAIEHDLLAMGWGGRRSLAA